MCRNSFVLRNGHKALGGAFIERQLGLSSRRDGSQRVRQDAGKSEPWFAIRLSFATREVRTPLEGRREIPHVERRVGQSVRQDAGKAEPWFRIRLSLAMAISI